MLECWDRAVRNPPRPENLDLTNSTGPLRPILLSSTDGRNRRTGSLVCNAVSMPPLTSFHLPLHPVNSQCMLQTRCYPLTWFVEQLVVVVGPPRRKPRQMILPERPAGSAKRPRMALRPTRPRLGIPWLATMTFVGDLVHVLVQRSDQLWYFWCVTYFKYFYRFCS